MKRHELLVLHKDLCEQAHQLMEAKNADYSSGQDPFHNFRMAQMVGISPEKGILMRMCDKIARLKTYAEHGKLSVENEGGVDSVVDIINYAVLYIGMVHEKQESKYE